MRIIQLLRNLAYGDAIGNDALAIRDALTKMGYSNTIYAEYIDQRLPRNTAYPVNRLCTVDSDDIILYHLSTGTDLNYTFAELNCRKIVRYHNITPPHFFHGYSSEAEQNCRDGLAAAEAIADKVDYCLADSEFNKQDLLKMGYKQKIDVLPILIPFADYAKSPDLNTIKKYSDGWANLHFTGRAAQNNNHSDGWTNFLFTGRVAPNKKHEDIIQLFYFYKNYVNEKSRLFLVGGYAQSDIYYQKLSRYVKMLRLKDVYFPGHIKFNQILAYYKLSDLYISMSEHEGFCVPLVEAMYFKKPILAYESTAVPETLGGGGVLMQEKDPKVGALLAERILNDNALYMQIIENQQKRLKDFSYDSTYSLLKRYIAEFVEG